MTFQRILVPVDGSPPSQAAGTVAVGLSRDLSCELVFCCIVDSGWVTAECASSGCGDPTPIIQALTDDAAQVLAQHVAEAKAGNVSSRSILQRDGHAAAGIVDLAKDLQADLIVIGSHGRSGLSRLVMGSTTAGVLRATGVPVLLVREGTARRASADSAAPSLAKSVPSLA